MKLFSKKLFLGGLIICCLLLTLGVYFMIIPKKPAVRGYPPANQDKGVIYIRDEKGQTVPSKKTYTAPKVKDTTSIYHRGKTIPKMTEQDMWVAMMTWHAGPQTVEALMESYHVAYLQSKRHREIDMRVPPEQWLQSVLDKGYTILNYLEYAQYMDARAVTDNLDTPQILKMYSESYEIPETEIDRIKALYLENHLLFLKRKHIMERTVKEPVTGGIHIGDKVLPFYRDRDVVYVQRHESGAQYNGVKLTAEQRFNLIFRGIEPEGIEIIYIDELGNQLSEKPKPITREEVRKMMSEGEVPPPKEWWDPEAPVPDVEEFEEFLPPERGTDLDFERRREREEFERAREEFERHAAEVERQPEFEEFLREVRQLEKFATMSDAEIAAELEKQLRQQLLPGASTEASLEDAVREKIPQKPLTSERFSKAKQILQNYGPKEGLRRLTEADPELAEYFRRNPQKVPPPKRPQPSNADDSQKE